MSPSRDSSQASNVGEGEKRMDTAVEGHLVRGRSRGASLAGGVVAWTLVLLVLVLDLGETEGAAMFSTAKIGQNNPIMGTTNVVTATLIPVSDLASGLVISISGLTGADPTIIPAESGFTRSTPSAETFNHLQSTWTDTGGVLTAEVGTGGLTTGEAYTIDWDVFNHGTEAQAGGNNLTITISADGYDSQVMDGSSGESALGVINGTDILKNVEPVFEAGGEVHQSTPLADVVNSITVSFKPSCHLGMGSTITIKGFGGNFQDYDMELLAEDSVEGAFSTPSWAYGSGTIILTVSGAESGYISNSGFTSVTLSVRNKPASSNTALDVTVEGRSKIPCTSSQNAPIKRCRGVHADVKWASVSTKSGVTLLEMEDMGNPGRTVFPTWSLVEISHRNPLAGGSNTITAVLSPDLTTPAGSTITIGGLTGTRIGSGAMLISTNASSSILADATWEQDIGKIVLTTNETIGRQQVLRVWFEVLNPDSAQSAPQVYWEVTVESGVFDVTSEQRQNYQTSTVSLLGIPQASGVLFTHLPSVIETSAQQSHPFAGATNTISLAFSLDVDLLALNSSAITLSGLLIAGRSQETVALSGPSSSSFAASNGGPAGQGTYHGALGSFVVYVAPGGVLNATETYNVSFDVLNPDWVQTAEPTLEITTSGTTAVTGTVSTSNETFGGIPNGTVPLTVSCPGGLYNPSRPGPGGGVYSAGRAEGERGVCSQCGAGKYSSMAVGYEGEATKCLLCPNMTYSASQGATSASTCLPCVENSYSWKGSPSKTSCICASGWRPFSPVPGEDCYLRIPPPTTTPPPSVNATTPAPTPPETEASSIQLHVSIQLSADASTLDSACTLAVCTTNGYNTSLVLFLNVLTQFYSLPSLPSITPSRRRSSLLTVMLSVLPSQQATIVGDIASTDYSTLNSLLGVMQLPTMTVTGTATTCGYGKTPSGPSCVPCPVNTYKPTTDNATCASCPGTTRTGTVTGARFMGHCTCAPGTYLPSGVAQGSAACPTCPANSWCPGGLSINNPALLLPCPLKSVSPLGSTNVEGCVCPSEWLYWPILQNVSYATDAATAALISGAASRGLTTSVLWTCYPKPPPTTTTTTTTTTPAPTPATTPAPTPPPPRAPRPPAITWPRTDVQKFGDAVSKGFAGVVAGVVALGVLGGVAEMMGADQGGLQGAVGGTGRAYYAGCALLVLTHLQAMTFLNKIGRVPVEAIDQTAPEEGVRMRQFVAEFRWPMYEHYLGFTLQDIDDKAAQVNAPDRREEEGNGMTASIQTRNGLATHSLQADNGPTAEMGAGAEVMVGTRSAGDRGVLSVAGYTSVMSVGDAGGGNSGVQKAIGGYDGTMSVGGYTSVMSVEVDGVPGQVPPPSTRVEAFQIQSESATPSLRRSGGYTTKPPWGTPAPTPAITPAPTPTPAPTTTTTTPAPTPVPTSVFTGFGYGECKASSGDVLVSRLIISAAVLLGALLLRFLIHKATYPGKGRGQQPASFVFPMWEAPALLSQFIPIVDGFAMVMGTGCFYWQIIGGTLLLVGPVLGLLFLFNRMERAIDQDSVSYVNVHQYEWDAVLEQFGWRVDRRKGARTAEEEYVGIYKQKFEVMGKDGKMRKMTVEEKRRKIMIDKLDAQKKAKKRMAKGQDPLFAPEQVTYEWIGPQKPLQYRIGTVFRFLRNRTSHGDWVCSSKKPARSVAFVGSYKGDAWPVFIVLSCFRVMVAIVARMTVRKVNAALCLTILSLHLSTLLYFLPHSDHRLNAADCLASLCHLVAAVFASAPALWGGIPQTPSIFLGDAAVALAILGPAIASVAAILGSFWGFLRQAGNIEPPGDWEEEEAKRSVEAQERARRRMPQADVAALEENKAAVTTAQKLVTALKERNERKQGEEERAREEEERRRREEEEEEEAMALWEEERAYSSGEDYLPEELMEQRERRGEEGGAWADSEELAGHLDETRARIDEIEAVLRDCDGNYYEIFGEELEDEQADLAVEIEELEFELEYLSSKEQRKNARKAQGVTYAAAQLKLAKKKAEREAESSIKGNPRLEESFRSRRSGEEEEEDESVLAERDRYYSHMQQLRGNMELGITPVIRGNNRVKPPPRTGVGGVSHFPAFPTAQRKDQGWLKMPPPRRVPNQIDLPRRSSRFSGGGDLDSRHRESGSDSGWVGEGGGISGGGWSVTHVSADAGFPPPFEAAFGDGGISPVRKSRSAVAVKKVQASSRDRPHSLDDDGGFKRVASLGLRTAHHHKKGGKGQYTIKYEPPTQLAAVMHDPGWSTPPKQDHDQGTQHPPPISFESLGEALLVEDDEAGLYRINVAVSRIEDEDAVSGTPSVQGGQGGVGGDAGGWRVDMSRPAHDDDHDHDHDFGYHEHPSPRVLAYAH